MVELYANFYAKSSFIEWAPVGGPNSEFHANSIYCDRFPLLCLCFLSWWILFVSLLWKMLKFPCILGIEIAIFRQGKVFSPCLCMVSAAQFKKFCQTKTGTLVCYP